MGNVSSSRSIETPSRKDSVFIVNPGKEVHKKKKRNGKVFGMRTRTATDRCKKRKRNLKDIENSQNRAGSVKSYLKRQKKYKNSMCHFYKAWGDRL